MSEADGPCFLFMGEQKDPEFDVWAGRGLRVYDGQSPAIELPPRPPPTIPPPPSAGLWVVQTDGVFAKCGCGQCFYGPCSEPTQLSLRPRDNI